MSPLAPPNAPFCKRKIALLMTMTNQPDWLLFAQHGMTDTYQTMAWLGRQLATDRTTLIAPNLGYLRTLWHIEPLIEIVDRTATEAICQHPTTPMRIVATSLGGLLWLEVLQRHPDWWGRVQSLVLLGSPIGGSDLARMVDPFGWGIGIAKGLGTNRRSLAEASAAVIPTLVIAGDTDGGSDGTVTIASTRFNHAHFVCLPGVNHPALRHNPAVVATIRQFWATSPSPLPAPKSLKGDLMQRLQAVAGMTDGHQRGFDRAKPRIVFKDGTQIRTWHNPLQVMHVFISNAQGECCYGGFVGWLHARELEQELAGLRQTFSREIQVVKGLPQK
jgi:hypothetical protein